MDIFLAKNFIDARWHTSQNTNRLVQKMFVIRAIARGLSSLNLRGVFSRTLFLNWAAEARKLRFGERAHSADLAFRLVYLSVESG
jgi:hypothetical protein